MARGDGAEVVAIEIVAGGLEQVGGWAEHEVGMGDGLMLHDVEIGSVVRIGRVVVQRPAQGAAGVQPADEHARAELAGGAFGLADGVALGPVIGVFDGIKDEPLVEPAGGFQGGQAVAGVGVVVVEPGRAVGGINDMEGDTGKARRARFEDALVVSGEDVDIVAGVGEGAGPVGGVGADAGAEERRELP